MFFLRTLSLRIRIGLLVTLGFVLVFAIMVWLAERVSDATTQMALHERLTLARTIALGIDQDLERTMSRLAQVAALPTIDLEDGDLEPEKAELRALYRPEIFSYAFLLDKDALVLWTEPYLPEAVGIQHLECPHVQEVLRTGQAAVACVTRALTPQSPVVTPLMPIRDEEGNIEGILGVAIDPTSSAFAHLHQEITPGITGHVHLVLVDEDGVILASTSDQERFQYSEKADFFTPLLQENKAVITITMESEEGRDPFRQVIAFAPLSTAPWGVVVEQEEAELLAPAIESHRVMEILSAITLVSVLLLTWVTTGSIVAPLRKLVAAAQRITSGDLTTPVPLHGKDEIGKLACHFEEMRLHLAHWGEELETAVQKRTRELSVLYSIDRAVAHSLNLEEILPTALETVLSALQIEAGGVYLLMPDEKTMTLCIHRGFSEEFARNVQCIQLGEGISGRAAAEKKPLVLDVSDYPTSRLIPFIIQEDIQTLASAPLLSAGDVVGALNLAMRHPRAFSAEELDLLASIGQQLGGTVHNARLYAAEQQHAARLSLLNHVACALGATMNTNELLEIVYREVTTVIEADAFFIALYDRVADELDFRVQVDKGVREPPVRRPLAPGLTSLVVTSRQPLLIHNFEIEKDHLPPTRLWGSMQAPQSWLGVPLLLGEDVLGVISVQAYRADAYGEAERELLSTIADAVAVAVENARLYQAQRQHAAQLKIIGEVGRQIASILDLDELLHQVVNTLVESFGYYHANLLLVEANTNEIVLKASAGQAGRRFEGDRLKIGQQGIIGWVAGEGQPLLVNDVTQEPRYRFVEELKDTRSELAAPILLHGEVIGVIDVQSVRLNAFDEEDLFTLQALAEQAAVTTENARLYQKVLASEREYRTLVENANELIWTLDTEGHFTFFNEQAKAVTGYKLEDWMGKSFAPLFVPEELPGIQQIIQETLGGKAQSYDARVYHANGSLLYLAVNTAPLYREGKVAGTISFGRDVTAQREAEIASQRRLTELSALFAVSSALREATTLKEMLPIILDKTTEVLGAKTGVLVTLDKSSGTLIVQATHGEFTDATGYTCRLEELPASCAIKSGQPSFDHNGCRLYRFIGQPKKMICVPLVVEEEMVGGLYLSTESPQGFSQGDVNLLTAIADMAAAAIRRASLFEELQHRVYELSTFFDVGRAITSTLRVEDVVSLVVQAATRALHAEGCSLFLWNDREQRIVMRATTGAAPELVGQVGYRSGEGLTGWVFLERRPANVPDVAADPRWKQEPEQEKTLPAGQIISALMVPLVVGEKILGVLGVANKIGAPAFTDNDQSLLTTLAGQVAIAIENARLYEDVRGLSVATIRSLAAAIDARDPYTRGHSEGVTHLTVQLARELGWSGADLEMLEIAALLHDVGKIAVPDAILKKDTSLTPEEWNSIYLHPYYSVQIVKPVEPLQRIILWIYHHHERWDGTGYPDGLKGKKIPLGARIITLADAFNAMTTDRPYHIALSLEDALIEVKRCAGSQFDPQVVRAFQKILDRSESSPS